MNFKHKMEARKLLILHYWKIIGHSWNNRDQLGGNLFTEDEAEFLPAALSLQEKPVSRASRIAAGVLMAMVVALFVWAVVGRMDIIVTARGEIIPSQRTKTIASVEIASVKALHVQEGQAVKAGDVLIELDPSIPAADQAKASNILQEATLETARSKALIAAIDSLKPPKLSDIDGIPPQKLREAQEQVQGQYQDFITKLHRIDGQIRNYAEALPLARQEASDYKELAKNRDVSVHAYLDKEQARIELEGKLTDARNQRAALIAETRRTAYDAWTDGEKTIGAARPEMQKAADRKRLLKLVSPVDGTVQQLTVHTIGGVVPAAQPLMVIVPKQHKIEVEAKVLNKDIGFVKEGQTVAVKVEAFPYTKYGLVPAVVTHISRDAIKDDKLGLIYSVIVELQKTSMLIDGREVKLSPGMSVTTDIKTGDRRVVEYVLSPLIQYARESLHER
jgi:hemolysin D